MAENLQQISPVVPIITELVSTGVMGVVAAMAWLAYKDERKRSMELVKENAKSNKEYADAMVEINMKQIASETQMVNTLAQNNEILKETNGAVAANTAVMQSLSDRIGVVMLAPRNQD